jgi:TRAP-type uncharacterized transport system fused permease subunit
VTATTAIGIWAYAGATQGWLFGKTGRPVQLGLVAAGTLLLFPSLLETLTSALGPEHIDMMKSVGLALTLALAIFQRMRAVVRRRAA